MVTKIHPWAAWVYGCTSTCQGYHSLHAYTPATERWADWEHLDRRSEESLVVKLWKSPPRLNQLYLTRCVHFGFPEISTTLSVEGQTLLSPAKCRNSPTGKVGKYNHVIAPCNLLTGEILFFEIPGWAIWGFRWGTSRRKKMLRTSSIQPSSARWPGGCLASPAGG